MYKHTDIPFGRENAISRTALADLWNCSDRTMRERIARLRSKESPDGTFIASHSQGGVKGYYRTDKPDEIRHYINEGRKRIRNTQIPVDNAQKLLKAIMEKSA